MIEAEIAKLSSWLAKVGLEGRTETALVEGFCQRVAAAGLPLARTVIFIDTLHPIHEGRAFRWEREKPEATAYRVRTQHRRRGGRTLARPAHCSACWPTANRSCAAVSPPTGKSNSRCSPSYARPSITDFVGIVHRFAADGVIGEMDCFYSSWMTDRAEGFTDDDIAALKRLTPFLGLAIKSASLARIAETLVETYLGRDAGPAGSAGPHRARRRGPHQGRAVVQRPAQLYAHLRHAPPEQIIPAAQRLRRRDRLGHPPEFGRRAEADRRRRARDLSGARSRPAPAPPRSRLRGSARSVVEALNARRAPTACR